jgi:hypothetical protein
MPNRRPVSDYLLRLAAEGRQDDPEFQRACMWADYSPELLNACCGLYVAYHQRKTNPKALKEALAFADEVTAKVWSDVWAQLKQEAAPTQPLKTMVAGKSQVG